MDNMERIEEKDFEREFLEWEQMSRDTIDVKRIYIDVAGDLVTGILLSQIVFYFLPNKKGESKLKVVHDGKEWLAKKREDWWEECRITPKQFDRSIKILEEKGIIETKVMKFKGNPTKHIHLNITTLLNEIRKIAAQNNQNIHNNETNLDDEKQETSFFPKGKKPEKPTVSGQDETESRGLSSENIDTTGFSPKVKNEIPEKGKIVFALSGRTITENNTTKNYSTENKKNNLQGTTAGVSLFREIKPPKESIYLLSKKVNNKLVKLIKINAFRLFLLRDFLEIDITIKPSKYKVLRYRDDNVYSRIKNNKNLSLEIRTNSKDLDYVSRLHTNTNTDTVPCSNDKNIFSGRDDISQVRDYTNRKDTEPVSYSYEKGSIYALTRINAGINNLNLGAGEKASEYSNKDNNFWKSEYAFCYDNRNTRLGDEKDISFCRDKGTALCSRTIPAEKNTDTAQQAEEDPGSWKKVSSDEEIRYSYGDWDDYSIEEFDGSTVHTSPKAVHEIFNAGTAAVWSDKDEVSSSTGTSVFERERGSVIESAAFHSSEAVTRKQVSEAKAIKPEAGSRRVNTKAAAGSCFAVIDRQAPEMEAIKADAVKHCSKVWQLIYLLNRHQGTLISSAASNKHVFPRDGPL